MVNRVMSVLKTRISCIENFVPTALFQTVNLLLLSLKTTDVGYHMAHETKLHRPKQSNHHGWNSKYNLNYNQSKQLVQTQLSFISYNSYNHNQPSFPISLIINYKLTIYLKSMDYIERRITGLHGAENFKCNHLTSVFPQLARKT